MTGPALTYQARHWYTGEMKTRCAACGKVVFPDQAAAERAATKISERQPMWAYRGHCGHWHLTRKKPKRARS